MRAPSWGRGASLTFPLPSSWSPTVAFHAVPRMIHTLTPSWTLLNRTSSILPVSVKAKQLIAARSPSASPAVPICLLLCFRTSVGTTVRSAHSKLNDTSERKLLGEPRGQQLACVPTKL